MESLWSSVLGSRRRPVREESRSSCCHFLVAWAFRWDKPARSMNILFPPTWLSPVPWEVPPGDITCRCLDQWVVPVHAGLPSMPCGSQRHPNSSLRLVHISHQLRDSRFTPLGSACWSWWKPLFPFLTQLYMYNPSGRPPRSNNPSSWIVRRPLTPSTRPSWRLAS